MKKEIYIGWDPREDDAYRVAELSIDRHSHCFGRPFPISPIRLDDCRAKGLYWREHIEYREDGQPPYLFDKISGAPMSTEFAISRFLTPILAKRQGWALFMDCDFMARADLHDLFAEADARYAVQVVKHAPQPAGIKMDGQAQQTYPRKNWSSLMLFNCGHPANANLTPELINTQPGRDLHAFCWLPDRLIGDLDPRWNHLVGVDAPDQDALMAHFTLGVPSMPGYRDCEFAEEWRTWLPFKG